MTRNRVLRRLIVGMLVLLLSGILAAPLAASAPAGDAQGAAQPAWQDETTITVVLLPTQDNTLYEDTQGALSNGKGQYFFAGTTGGGDIRRGLLAFDVAGTVPGSATVVSATLELAMSRSNAGAVDVQLHRVQAAWGEGNSNAPGEEGGGTAAAPGDATWLHTFYNTATWTTPGGDYRATPTASTSVGAVGSYHWRSTQMVVDVQQWLDTPETDFGWMLIGGENANGTAKRFDTRENSVVDHRPALTITYTLPPEKRYLPLVRRS